MIFVTVHRLRVRVCLASLFSHPPSAPGRFLPESPLYLGLGTTLLSRGKASGAGALEGADGNKGTSF